MNDDTVWTEILAEAEQVASGEAGLQNFLELTVLSRETLEEGLAHYLSRKLGEGTSAFPPGLFLEALQEDSGVADAVRGKYNRIRFGDCASQFIN